MDSKIELTQVDRSLSDSIVHTIQLPPPPENATSQTLAESVYYPPLSDYTKQIRLCQIMPVSSNDGPVLMIGPHELDCATGRYIALSYACGGDTPKLPIRVNGSVFYVRRNLHTQLCRLRSVTCERRVWIDAICIDQLNESEKKAQVSMMDRIFTGAEEVFIGCDEDVTSLCQAALDHALLAVTLGALASGLHFQDLGLSQHQPGRVGCDSVNRILCRFLNSAWFRRVWVIQEICLAQNATLLLSHRTVPWGKLTRACEQWNTHRQANCCSGFVAELEDPLREAFHRVRYGRRNYDCRN